jgi:hypothetical protein
MLLRISRIYLLASILAGFARQEAGGSLMPTTA